jgi:hypothetical protein
MNQIMQAAGPVKPPAPPSRNFSNLVASYRMSLDPAGIARFSILRRFAPTDSDRAVLERRRAELQASLRPASQDQIAARVTRLYQHWPAARNLNVETTTSACGMALAAFPSWAIDRACLDAIEGRVGNVEHPPSAPLLRKAAERACDTVRAELVDIEKILKAEIVEDIPAEERKRIADDVRAMVRKAATGSDMREVSP